MSAPWVIKNPYSGEELARLASATDKQVQQALAIAKKSFETWRYSPAWERSQLLEQVAERLAARREEFASLICSEAGKPITLARIEVERAIGVFKWASAEALRFAGELLRIDTTSGGRPGFGIHARFPRGVILGITPFNFPLNLVAHKVAPALACGSPIIVKPSPSTPLTALKLAELITELKPGLMQVVLADDSMSAKLTQAAEVGLVSFTGSARVGHLIRRQALDKPVVLELGGNAWVLVLEDTPREKLPAIAKRIAGAAYGYAGQSCISVQNAAISSALWSELHPLIEEATLQLPFGDPSKPETTTGPLIHEQASQRVRAALAQTPQGTTIAASKKLVGADAPALVSPTLLTFPAQADLDQSTLVQEELFGPVLNAIRFDQLETVIHHVNSSHYGLQTGVFTQNLGAIQELFQKLDVGGVVVNDVPTTRYDHQPYGGVKDSGEGREGVKYAMEEMTRSKFLALSSKILGIVLLAGATLARADARTELSLKPASRETLREMDTDRPSRAESPYTVDAGHFQLELDLASYTRDGARDKEQLGIGWTNLKFGLTSNTDVQLIVESLTFSRIGSAASRGVGDLTLRLKTNFYGIDQKGAAVAGMPFLIFPTRDNSRGVQGGYILPAYLFPAPGWCINLSAEIDYRQDESASTYHTELIHAASLNRELSDRLTVYAEYWGNRTWEPGTGYLATADFGMTYLATPDLQLDAGINVGLTADTDDLNPFVGFSVRY